MKRSRVKTRPSNARLDAILHFWEPGARHRNVSTASLAGRFSFPSRWVSFDTTVFPPESHQNFYLYTASEQSSQIKNQGHQGSFSHEN